MLYSAPLIAILIPFIILQYGLALFCLVKLVFLDLPKKKFFPWNFFILLVVGVGVITFLICYYGFRDKVFPKAASAPVDEVTNDCAEDSEQTEPVADPEQNSPVETEPAAEAEKESE